MNRKNIATLIQDIRRSNTFTMQIEVLHDCGSPGCLVGHAAFRKMGIESYSFKTLINGAFSHVIERLHATAREYLGLNRGESMILFTPIPAETGYNWAESSGPKNITRDHAVCMLEALYRGAEIDCDIWRNTDPKTPRGRRMNSLWLLRSEFGIHPVDRVWIDEAASLSNDEIYEAASLLPEEVMG